MLPPGPGGTLSWARSAGLSSSQLISQPTLVRAAALMTSAVPVVVFLFAQRAFMRGVVVTGMDKRRARYPAAGTVRYRSEQDALRAL